MDFLDVGQGDGIYFETKDYRAFVDGGSSSNGKVGTYVILPFLKYHGARKIDYWFVSHGDKDHISGLKEVLESGYRVEHLVISRYAVMNEELREILDLAHAHGTVVDFVDNGNRLVSNSAVLEFISPQSNANNDANENSLVILLKCKDFSALLTGDIGADTEKILASNNKLSHVDILKVPHHGSKYSTSVTLLEKTTPNIAIISCSKKNRYGHPAPETINRLETKNVLVRYTMNEGQITYKRRNYESNKYANIK